VYSFKNNNLTSHFNLIQSFIKLKGPKQEHAPACDYVLQMYLKQNPDKDRQCYSHFTTATG
jgi:guanine nucleotide-binding protein G(q) subunit alpha